MMGNRSSNHSTFVNRTNGDTLRDYYLTAVASGFDMSADDLEKQVDSGKSLLDVAAEKDMSVKDFNTLLTNAHTTAVDQMLAEGVISQKQADQMKKDPESSFGYDMGSGMGLCWYSGIVTSSLNERIKKFGKIWCTSRIFILKKIVPSL